MIETGDIHKTKLPSDWKVPEEWLKWSLKCRKEWCDKHAKACAKKFKEYYVSRGTEKQDWEIAWKNWVMRQKTKYLEVTVPKGYNWWESCSGIEAKGKEIGIEYLPDETFPYYKLRVLKAEGLIK